MSPIQEIAERLAVLHDDIRSIPTQEIECGAHYYKARQTAAKIADDLDRVKDYHARRKTWCAGGVPLGGPF